MAEQVGARRVPVTVTVDAADLREWAGRHADSGHHGVAHVLYQAAEGVESITEQHDREVATRALQEAASTTSPWVAGKCPACGSETLFLADGGYVACSLRSDQPGQSCPYPTAAATLLDDGETEHIVDVTATGFTIRHPLIERVNGDLFTCDIHSAGLVDAEQAQMNGPGRYRVVVTQRGVDGQEWSYPHATWTVVPRG